MSKQLARLLLLVIVSLSSSIHSTAFATKESHLWIPLRRTIKLHQALEHHGIIPRNVRALAALDNDLTLTDPRDPVTLHNSPEDVNAFDKLTESGVLTVVSSGRRPEVLHKRLIRYIDNSHPGKLSALRHGPRIGSVGTEITAFVDGEHRHIEEWTAFVNPGGRWVRDSVVDAVRSSLNPTDQQDVHGIWFQGDDEQGAFKVALRHSRGIEGEKDIERTIHQALRDRGFVDPNGVPEYELRFSWHHPREAGIRNGDIVARRGGKLNAANWLKGEIQSLAGQVVEGLGVGDSGNDIDILGAPDWVGLLVGNAPNDFRDSLVENARRTGESAEPLGVHGDLWLPRTRLLLTSDKTHLIGSINHGIRLLSESRHLAWPH